MVSKDEKEGLNCANWELKGVLFSNTPNRINNIERESERENVDMLNIFNFCDVWTPMDF